MRRTLAAALLLASLPVAGAGQVVCHYTYGGETKTLAVHPAASPYAEKGVKVGSYFQFRPVFQSEPAALKVYTYVDRDESPALIHQATFPYPPAGIATGPHGFTGLHFVYEPVRDSELQYWCDMSAANEPEKSS